MENPNAWTMAHNVIHRAIMDCNQEAVDGTVGGSVESYIVNYLERYGFLTPRASEVTGFVDVQRPVL